VDITLEQDWEHNRMKIPVKIEVEPERIEQLIKNNDAPHNGLENLVSHGLRAQLKTGNFITGGKYVAIDFFNNSPPASIVMHGDLIEIPTVPTSLDELTNDLTALLNKLSSIPLEEIGSATLDTIKSLNEAGISFRKAGDGISQIVSSSELEKAIHSLTLSLEQIQGLTSELEKELPSAINTVSKRTIATLGKIEKLTASDSDVVFELKRVLKEFARAAQSISRLADHLERHPESIIKGKGREY